MGRSRLQALRSRLDTAIERFEQCMEVASMDEPELPTEELVGVIDQVQALEDWLVAAEPYIGCVRVQKIRRVMEATEQGTVTLQELLELEPMIEEAKGVIDRKAEQLEQAKIDAEVELDEAEN